MIWIVFVITWLIIHPAPGLNRKGIQSVSASPHVSAYLRFCLSASQRLCLSASLSFRIFVSLRLCLSASLRHCGYFEFNE